MIRPYVTGDKPAVLSIWRETSALAHPFLTAEFTDMAEAMIADVFLDMADTWITEDTNGPVGFVALIGNEVGGLFVRPAHHGKGYGRAMMDLAVAQVGALELDVFSLNMIGRKFYQRYGFEEGEERLDEQSGQRVLRLRLPAT